MAKLTVERANSYFKTKKVFTQAQADMSVDHIVNSSRISHKSIDAMVDTANLVSKVNSEQFGKSLDSASDRVYSSASYTDNGKFYSSSYKEMARERRLERRWDDEEERWNAIIASAPHQTSANSKKQVAKVRQVKKLPSATYIIEDKRQVAEYNPRNDYSRDYVVVDYRVYRKAVVLELQTDNREAYLNRQTPESNKLSTYLVFRYQPIGKDGKPNPYDGLTQLKDFFKAQKFITENNPSTLKQALELLKDELVTVPSAYEFNLTSKSDFLTVYTVFGDFDLLDIEFTKEATEFKPNKPTKATKVRQLATVPTYEQWMAYNH